MTRLQRLGRGLMLLAAVCMAPAAAFEVTDIQLEGLERISAGTVFNYLPIKIGDEVDSADVSKAIRTLFKTGFFSDVQLLAEANVLIVVLEERPAISEIDIEGNELLETEPLLEGLAGIGLAKGRVFKRALLEQVEQELRRQYFGQGQYSVRIESTVTPLGRNRVAIKIIVTEGATAKIRQINIVGNEAFDDDALRDQFKLSTPTLFSF
ncbi:MAG TPA: outer membrane protein assembly factor BamA, partial [Chromatiaceae bacterium]|nr:outer membrane protein assembly factor BamA [Chromatiaceae bacterium]